MTDYKQLWDRCLGEIEGNLSRANFNTWFKNTFILKEESNTVFLGVPNEFVRDWLSNKYHKLIIKTFMNYFNEIRSVEYIISKPENKNRQINSQITVEIKNQPVNQELPIQNLFINKEDNLNPRYVFDNFIVGPFNELAYAAAQAIINKPGTAYNPFFIYGGTGLGKTHLIQAIGNTIKNKYPEKKIHYVTLEKFSIDYVNSVQNNKANLFKEKYRKYDVLIMDDIQFISTKEKTKEELFHLFNSLYENNKQIIFSSDRHPNYIPGLEDRLKSRFSAGMIVEVNEPDFESRLAILKVKINEINASISEEIVNCLASIIQGNIRELEGSLNAVVCQNSLKIEKYNKELNEAEVRSLIKNNIRPKKNVSIKDVVKVISNFYNLDENLIYDKTRRKEVVKARQVAMFILREDFNVSYPLIGQKIGGKDHTTVIHSCLKIKNDLKEDNLLNQEVEQIRVMFK
jgi:chromosomal replication initiator protein